MPFLGSVLGLTAMCSLGWGNLVAFDWNDLPVGREFDWKFLKKVKSPPYALPPRRHYIDRCISKKSPSVTTANDDTTRYNSIGNFGIS